MPAPPATPKDFVGILEQVWWRLDQALDLEIIAAAARLGALEALEAGCTAIVDHHESPDAIDGSLSAIAGACAEVGVRVLSAYGVTDRHGPDGRDAGLDECARFISEGGRGMVGLHAAFTCEADTIAAAAELARSLGVGVHVHVCEDLVDADAVERLAGHTTDDWILAHCVHLPTDHGLSGTIVHNPRSNMNNAVGYAHPTRFTNPVALGSDGIGASMLDEFRVAFARLRESDVTASPETAWAWLEAGWSLMPDARNDVVTWSYPEMDAWHLAYTTDVRPLSIVVDGVEVLADGGVTRVDADQIRAHAAEAASRLFERL
jgi:cytosine/adenosine deaminase-related metal-dependent hydrolase